jgi:hypothetical protein
MSNDKLYSAVDCLLLQACIPMARPRGSCSHIKLQFVEGLEVLNNVALSMQMQIGSIDLSPIEKRRYIIGMVNCLLIECFNKLRCTTTSHPCSSWFRYADLPRMWLRYLISSRQLIQLTKVCSSDPPLSTERVRKGSTCGPCLSTQFESCTKVIEESCLLLMIGLDCIDLSTYRTLQP